MRQVTLYWRSGVPTVRELPAPFTLNASEKAFALKLLRSKPNFWLFRGNQKGREGDFAVLDYSRANRHRPQLGVRAFYFELKDSGGARGIQLQNAEAAVRALTPVFPPNVELIEETAPDAVLARLGVT